MYYIYALKSISKNYIYIGLTKDIKERFKRHNLGREPTTRSYRPFKIIFLTTRHNRKEAREIEVYLKQGNGREFLKSLF